MSVTPIVEKCFSALSVGWFEKIKSEFQKHPFYDGSEGRISQTIMETTMEGELEVPIDVSLSTYCWTNSVNSFAGSGYIDEDNFFKPDAKELTQPIIDFIEKAVSSLSNVGEKYQVIKAVKSSIIEMRTIKRSDDQEYNAAMEYITDKLYDNISLKFSDITSLAEDILPFSGKIKFEINQNELAMLIILLYRAGVIDESFQPEKATVDFIKNSCLYKDDETGEYKIPKTLNSQVSLLKGQYAPWDTPLNSLKEKINSGFAEFMRLRH